MLSPLSSFARNSAPSRFFASSIHINTKNLYKKTKPLIDHLLKRSSQTPSKKQAPFTILPPEQVAEAYSFLDIDPEKVTETLKKHLPPNYKSGLKKQLFKITIKEQSLHLTADPNTSLEQGIAACKSTQALILFKACLASIDPLNKPTLLAILAYPHTSIAPAFSTAPHNDGVKTSIISTMYLHPKAKATLDLGMFTPKLKVNDIYESSVYIPLVSIQANEIGMLEQGGCFDAKDFMDDKKLSSDTPIYYSEYWANPLIKINSNMAIYPSIMEAGKSSSHPYYSLLTHRLSHKSESTSEDPDFKTISRLALNLSTYDESGKINRYKQHRLSLPYKKEAGYYLRQMRSKIRREL
jgi:hypothetical protein